MFLLSIRYTAFKKINSASVVMQDVPQGCILKPTLFLISINDLPSGTNSQLGIYAWGRNHLL